jgi:hypothetical protein
MATSSRYVAVVAMLVAFAWGHSAFAQNAWSVPASKAAQWLSQQTDSGAEQQSRADGSWGSVTAIKATATSEAVLALRAYNQRNAAYYAGLVWLSDRNFQSVDAVARRVMAMADTGGNTANDVAQLLSAQRGGVGSNGGWGLSGAYNGSPLDTALVLQALQSVGNTQRNAVATAFLKASQLTGSDRGWPIGQSYTSDPTTTAHVILALQPLVAFDPSLASWVSTSAATLGARVTLSSPPRLKALAALALLKANPASSAALNLLGSLSGQQAADGSIGDAYSTALSLRAFALASGRDAIDARSVVAMPDAVLRAAINQSLGRSAMDQLNRGELGRLTSLDVNSLGITNLQGLQYATALISLNVSNNRITSFAPIAALNIPTLVCGGNVASCGTTVAGSDVDVPLPAWALWLFGGLLLGVLRKGSKA